MKKLIILLLLIPMFSFSQSSYQKGYKNGYKDGYCLEQENCLRPALVPNAPMPGVGNDTYSFGYQRGLIDGQKKNKERNESYTQSSSPKTSIYDAAFSNDNTSKENNNKSMQAILVPLEQRGKSTYFPKPRKNKKKFKKLNVSIFKGFGSLNLGDYSSDEDPMFLQEKLFLGLKRKDLIVSPNSPYIVDFQYRYRADAMISGCGGVVFNKLYISITDNRNNKKVGEITFKQGNFESKCIDDVVYQTIERLIELNSTFKLTDYENEIIIAKSTENSKSNEMKNSNNVKSKDEAIKLLKELKELLDLELISKEEFDKKSKELKKIILGN